MTGEMRNVEGKEVARERLRHGYYVHIHVNLNGIGHENMVCVRRPKIGRCRGSCEHGNELYCCGSVHRKSILRE